MDWSDIPADLLARILSLLDLPDFVRSGAVCRRSNWVTTHHPHCRPKTPHIPWLMLSSPTEPNSRFFRSLAGDRKQKPYELRLPSIAGRHCIGSSEGLLVSIDPTTADLHLTNPLTGAHSPLPPTSTLPPPIADPPGGRPATHYLSYIPFTGTPVLIRCIKYKSNFYFHKAICSSPSADPTVFILYGEPAEVAFARPGDAAWTMLKSPIAYFNDLIIHRGRLYVVNYMGAVAVFEFADDYRRAVGTPVVSANGPSYRKSGGSRRYLVESPDGGELFMVYRDICFEEDDEGASRRTTTFTVFVLEDEGSFKWKEVGDIGDAALFLGFNESMSLSAREFPQIKKNCIYFTNDFKENYHFSPDEAGEDMGVFDLTDGSVQPIDTGNVDLKKFNWPPAVWFFPVHR